MLRKNVEIPLDTCSHPKYSLLVRGQSARAARTIIIPEIINFNNKDVATQIFVS
jgi:hypothetical protein